MGGARSTASQQWGGADQSAGAYENAVANIASGAAPENINVPISDVNDQIRNVSILNALRSLSAEKETNPNVAAAREELSKQVLADLQGGVPTSVKNDLIRAGLEDAGTVGVNAKGTATNDILRRIFGRGALDYRTQQQAKAAELLKANEKPVVGIDPGSVGQILTDQNVANTNQRNSFLQQNLGRRDQRLENFYNRLQQVKAMTASQASNNAASKNQMAGTVFGGITNLAGTALTAGLRPPIPAR